MYNLKIRLKSLFLGILSCLLVLGFYSPVLGGVAPQVTPSQMAQDVDLSDLNKAIATQLQTAKSALLAQNPEMSTTGLKSYVAVMSPANVVPAAPRTNARGVVGAVLSGDRLIVRGSFRELSSGLRDYTVDPVSPPNPNITSAFHIHRGMPSENGPFQYALTIMLDEMGRGGSAMGEYTLTTEQLEALNNGMLYVDLHTTRNRAGELRAVLAPS